MRSGTTDDRLVGGRYRLGEHLGSGGMGTVWRGRDELLQRDVAVKEVVIPEGMPRAEADKLRQRYLREARAAARLRHAYAVGVYDVLPEAGRVWIVMEFVEARNLAEVVRATGPLTPERAARMGRHLLDALSAAHAAGVLHRDVKPANVLIGDDRTVLTDFGVASVAGDPSLTGTGQVVGSPAYLSPERLTGRPAAPASDLWSLGCTLYAAVEGTPPFLRDEPFAVITAITLEPAPVPRRAGHLAPVLAGLLEKDPDQRWDAERTRAALDRVANGQPVEPTAGWGAPAGPDEVDTLRIPSERPDPWHHGPPAMPGSPGGVTPVSGDPYSPGYSAHQLSGAAASGAPAPTTSFPRYAAAGGEDHGHRPGGATPHPGTLHRGAVSRRGRVRRTVVPLVVALLVVAVAAGAGIGVRRAGLWPGDAVSPTTSSSPESPSPTVPGGATTAFSHPNGLYALRHPADWNAYCPPTGYEDLRCYFDKLAADVHEVASPDKAQLATNPYVLVISGPALGNTAYELLEEQDAAAKSKPKSFPGYQTQLLTDEYRIGPHHGALLEYTYLGTYTREERQVRIFRFVVGGTYYEISLRSPSSGFASFEEGFNGVAASLRPPA